MPLKEGGSTARAHFNKFTMNGVSNPKLDTIRDKITFVDSFKLSPILIPAYKQWLICADGNTRPVDYSVINAMSAALNIIIPPDNITLILFFERVDIRGDFL